MSLQDCVKPVEPRGESARVRLRPGVQNICRHLECRQLDVPKAAECIIETLNQRRQHNSRLDGASSYPERCIAKTYNRRRRYRHPGPLDVTNIQADLHISDPGIVNPSGQLRLVHVPEQWAAASRRSGPCRDQHIASARASKTL